MLLAVFERSLAAAMMHRGEHILNNQARSPQAVMQAVDSMGPRHGMHCVCLCPAWSLTLVSACIG